MTSTRGRRRRRHRHRDRCGMEGTKEASSLEARLRTMVHRMSSASHEVADDLALVVVERRAAAYHGGGVDSSVGLRGRHVQHVLRCVPLD